MANIILTNLSVGTQVPLDDKLYFLTLVDAGDLGASNARAFSYYEDMEVQVIEDHKKYIWREESTVGETGGLVATSYTYPTGIITEGITYGDRTFNFFEVVGGGGGSGTYDTVLTIDTTETVGNIPSGTDMSTLSGMTFTQLFDAVFASEVLGFIFDAANLVVTGINTSSVEVGTSYGTTVTVAYDSGIIRNGDGTNAGPVTGDLASLNVATPSNANAFVVGSVVGNTATGSIPNHIMTLGSNAFVTTGVNAIGTTTYTTNLGNTVANPVVDNAASDVTPNPITINKSAFYYRYNYLGARGTSPTTSSAIRALTNRAFLNSSNNGTFSILIPANTSEYTLYTIAGKTVTIIDTSTFADLAPAAVSTTVQDANSQNTSYSRYVVDLGLTGFPQDTTFNITIS